MPDIGFSTTKSLLTIYTHFGTLMCVHFEAAGVIVPNNAFSTTISSTTKLYPQHTDTVCMRIAVKAGGAIANFWV